MLVLCLTFVGACYVQESADSPSAYEGSTVSSPADGRDYWLSDMATPNAERDYDLESPTNNEMALDLEKGQRYCFCCGDGTANRSTENEEILNSKKEDVNGITPTAGDFNEMSPTTVGSKDISPTTAGSPNVSERYPLPMPKPPRSASPQTGQQQVSQNEPIDSSYSDFVKLVHTA